jgi:tetratricopeptide (TPR) repeat protein
MTFTLLTKVRFAPATLLFCIVMSLVAIALVSGRAAAPPEAQQVDVAKDIVPFVEKHCVKCHGAEKPKAGLSLHTFTHEKAILKERKLWDAALHLIESGEMPPAKQPQPTADEKKAFAKSVRAVYARADTGKPDPGRSLIRRLTRTEYGNTVRDLLQLDLDFKPEFELPTDALTHGFENNAEALTISPVLLDRYMATAELVAEQAIRVEFPKREVLNLEGQYHRISPGFSGAGVNVAVAKVVEKMTALAEANPKDALVRYRLARTHAAAYGLKADSVPVLPGRESEGVWFGSNPQHLPFEVRRVDDPAKVKTATEHLERATARYREVIQLEPENLSARLGLAWCLSQSGDKAKAIAEFRTTLAAAWMKEKELRPIDWRMSSIVGDGWNHLAALLDKQTDAKEIKTLDEQKEHIKRVRQKSPWQEYRLLDSSGGMPEFTGPLYTNQSGGAGNLDNFLRYGATDEFLFRVTLFVEQSAEPVRVAVFVGGPGLPEYSTAEERDQILGELKHKEIQAIKILKIAEVTARSIEAPQQIEVLISRRGRSGPLGILGIGLIKPKNDTAPVRLHFKFENEGPLLPISHQHILACSPDKPQAEQTREIIGRLLPKAFRRPVTKEEIEAIAKFADRAVANGKKWEVGMQHAVMAMLCSPKFLFRVELDDQPDSIEPHPIGEFDLAARLSYFLWSSLPDDELFKLAGEKKLSANLEAQVRRMLKDPRSRALVDNFAIQWLRLDSLKTHQADAKLFPNFDKDLREAMLEETRSFLQHMLREDRSLLELIDADYTFLNQRLAGHYRISDTLGNSPGAKVEKKGDSIPKDRFVRVQLQGSERGGILTHASLLTMTSPATRTSPVKRGAWVLENILGTPPPPPPPDVPELDQKEAKATTLRERLEQHRANAVCAGCHAKIDPLGFAFENYDAVGVFRKMEGNKAIDVSGTLSDGRKINGMSDLKKALLADKEKFARHVAEKMLTYALGRGVEYYDKRAVDRIVAETAKDDFRLSRMVIAIVQSEPFRLRRGKEQGP